MYKIDAKDERERYLSEQVFNLYMSAKDYTEYSKLLNELSEKENIDMSYLRQLRLVYIDNYANSQQISAYRNKVKIMKSSVPKYVKFCNELFSLSEKKRFDYLLSKNVNKTQLSDIFNRYKEYGGEYSYLLDDFYKKYSSFLAKRDYKKESSRYRSMYRTACQKFDTIVSLGFYSISDYLDFVGVNRRSDESKSVNSAKKFIITHDSEQWQRYLIEMEYNRKNTLEILKPRIREFMDKMTLGFLNNSPIDIIDYYLIVGNISFKKFKDICGGYVSSYEMALFNSFVTPYLSLCDSDSSIEECIKFGYRNIQNGEEITEEEKLCIMHFLRENYIPIVYFPIAVNKYLKGDLDIKFKSLKK